MYEHVVEHQIFLLLYCSTASTAQHSATISPHKALRRVVHGRSECDNASNQTEHIYGIAVPQAQHSTAQHSTAQSARTKPQSKYVPIRVRQRKQADRVGKSRASTCRRGGIQHAEFSKRTKKSKSARPTRYNYSHSAGVMREGFAFSFDLCKINCSYSVLCYICVQRPDCYPGAWGSWHLHLGICILASASRQVAPKRDLSVRFTSLVEQAQRAAEAACGAKRLVRIVDTEVPNFVDSSDGLADSQPWS